MSRREITIDKLNIRLPRGWRGDPNLLAMQIAEQIQRQAAGLVSTQRLDFELRGSFAGDARQVTERLGEQLSASSKRSRSRRQDR
jgi:hypothetical protein